MATNCGSIITGSGASCPTTPGVKGVYLQDIQYISAFTLSNEIITAITMSGTAKFQKFDSPKFTSSFSEKENINDENAVFSITPTITFKCAGRTTAMRNQFLALGKTKTIALVNPVANSWWLVGCTSPTNPSNDLGLTPSDGQFSTGTKKDDFNGLTMTLEGYTDVPAYEVSAGVALALING